MTKPPKKKRSQSEVAEERVRVSEVMLREATSASLANIFTLRFLVTRITKLMVTRSIRERSRLVPWIVQDPS